MFVLTKYELSAEDVGSLKYTVQSPLEVGWDVKEQKPEENDVTPVFKCVYLPCDTFPLFHINILTYLSGTSAPKTL